jgi:hypothetical protein
METIENNKLIAEFMGGIKSSVPNLIHLPQTIGQSTILCVKGSEGLPSGNYKVERINELQYYSSWDMLMPVVEQCLEKHNNLIDGRDVIDTPYSSIAQALQVVSLKETYNAVVEFIKEYN